MIRSVSGWAGSGWAGFGRAGFPSMSPASVGASERNNSSTSPAASNCAFRCGPPSHNSVRTAKRSRSSASAAGRSSRPARVARMYCTSAALAGSAGVSVAASGSGAEATNQIAADVLAYQNGDGTGPVSAIKDTNFGNNFSVFPRLSTVTVGPDHTVYVSAFIGGEFEVFSAQHGGFSTSSNSVSDFTPPNWATQQGFPFGEGVLVLNDSALDDFQTLALREVVADPNHVGVLSAVAPVLGFNQSPSNNPLAADGIVFAVSRDFGQSWVSDFTVGSETNPLAGGFALAYDPRTTNDTRTELGARFDELTALVPGQPVLLRARLAWAHDFVGDPALSAAFEALPGSTFTVEWRHAVFRRQKGIMCRRKTSRHVPPGAKKAGRLWCADSLMPGTIRRSTTYATGLAISVMIDY